MFLISLTGREGRRTLLVWFSAFMVLSMIAVGVFARNGWFPSTDALTGKKTGWFGRSLSEPPALAGGVNADSKSTSMPAAYTAGSDSALPPTATPQLSKEYVYAGSRLLAVEDANANAAPPADLAVWRPSSGTWYVMGGQNSASTTFGWGLSTDKAVPGDFDGDGKTDFSVFRPSTGEWYVINSSSGAWSVWQWGLSTDIRVPADYDGDGKTDRAIWRPSTGMWYIVRSSDDVTIYPQFGLSTDTPAPADYDGDGKADIAVWRSSSNTFYSINSGNGVLQTPGLAQSGDKPVSADYDGDGKADYAVYNSTTATWHIRNSATSGTPVTSAQWGNGGDFEVPNDYDGDGKVDLATWRNSNGNWFIRQSASGNSLRQVQWGIPGDIPVQAFYRR